MTWVPNVRRAWRWWSVQAMVLAGAVQTTWLALPDDMRASIPPAWVSALTIALLVLGTLGRLVDQGGGDG